MYFGAEPTVKIQVETFSNNLNTDDQSVKRTQKLFDNMTKPQILTNLINNVFNLYSCNLLWFETGSLNFYVKCESAEALENLWRSINDGTFAEQLQIVLLTESVIDDEDVSGLHMKTTMDRGELKLAYEKYMELGKNFFVLKTCPSTDSL